MAPSKCRADPLHPTPRCADAGTHLSAPGARTLGCFQVVDETARCHWHFPLALHILLHPNLYRSGVQCLKDVRISSVPPAGALGLIDDFGNAKCGPSFPAPDPASSKVGKNGEGETGYVVQLPWPTTPTWLGSHAHVASETPVTHLPTWLRIAGWHTA